ncbi:MAG: hypothetical protein WCS54_02825 [Fibrobacteraceae bacterium]
MHFIHFFRRGLTSEPAISIAADFMTQIHLILLKRKHRFYGSEKIGGRLQIDKTIWLQQFSLLVIFRRNIEITSILGRRKGKAKEQRHQKPREK